MSLDLIDECFRRSQAAKSRFPGWGFPGYTFSEGVKDVQTNTVTAEFETSYRLRPNTIYMPRGYERVEPPREVQCYAIYHRRIGHIPNYGGHIPGRPFRCGRTFGNDTVDAKRWLRGDLRPN